MGGDKGDAMKILVTGGGGFLGQALCRGLRARGHEVASFNRGHYAALEAMGVEQRRGDLADRDAVLDAARGCDAIFHNAAKAGAWSRDPREFYDANVAGTRHVIDACRTHGIGRLVYTSTPSVTHRATFPVAGLDAQQVPYGEHLKSPYAQTKKVAEQLVLAASDATLAAVALRPRLIWGPGDNQLLPRIVERARAGRLKLVGDGSNLVDTTYIDNAADAHLAAFDHLAPGSACAGRAYFVSNGDPRSMRETLTALLDAAGAPPPNGTIPFRAAYAIGAVCEAAWNLLPLRGEPPMTRFLAEQLVTTHWYSMAPAKRDFGWVPRVSFDDGLCALRAAWQGGHG
jgi:nucleoside-diphosphate-sugar epimerase